LLKSNNFKVVEAIGAKDDIVGKKDPAAAVSILFYEITNECKKKKNTTTEELKKCDDKLREKTKGLNET